MTSAPVVKLRKLPGFQPWTCHEHGCENSAKWHVTFVGYEEYRCDEHKYDQDSAAALRPSGPTSAPEPSELGAAAE